MNKLLFLILLYSFAFCSNDDRQKFALLVGENNGGSGLVKLSYAQSDAEKLYKTLLLLGNYKTDQTIILTNTTYGEIKKELLSIKTAIGKDKNSGSKLNTEFTFYYSGHADITGLRIKNQTYPYSELKNDLESLDTGLQIAILDACNSGAFLRQKGGSRGESFIVEKEKMLGTKGKAFISSSSFDEVSQESDQIKGSYFTHYFVNGLCGPGDISSDGKVSLNEAYQYAFHNTLLHSELSKGGQQHANYKFDLTGSGDVVITDLNESKSKVFLDKTLEGSISIRNANMQLINSVEKKANDLVAVWLPSEDMVFRNRYGSQVFQATLTADQISKNPTLKKDHFKLLKAEATVSRGDAVTLSNPVKVGITQFKAKGTAEVEASAISDLFRNCMVNDGEYVVVDREHTDEIMKEQSFQASGTTEAEICVKIGKILNIDMMVFGSFIKLGDNYFLLASVVDVETAKVAKSHREKFSDLNNFEVMEDSIYKIISNLKIVSK